jgi:hypothetical protein
MGETPPVSNGEWLMKEKIDIVCRRYHPSRRRKTIAKTIRETIGNIILAPWLLTFHMETQRKEL